MTAKRKLSERTDRIVDTRPATVSRYATHTRFNHWFTAALIVLLMLSGFALFHPALYGLTGLFGGGQNARYIHPILGVVACLSFLAMFIQLWRFNIMRREDVIWAKHISDVVTGHEERLPELGKYNLGQKVVFWGMFWLLLIMVISGVMIWEQMFPNLASVPLRRWAVAIHALAAVAMVLLIVLHIFAAVWTRGTMSAMTRGTVSGGWAFRHHRKWLREVARRQRTPRAK